MRQVQVLPWVLIASLFVTLTGCSLPGITPTASSAQGRYSGQILDLNGKPAADVVVHGYLISNNAGSIISNNSGSLVSNNTAAYKTQAVQLDALTDASGRFTLASDASELNIEAVLSDNVKAIKLAVPRASQGLELQLAYTGSITGRVKASGTAVTNFEGVDVYIPGTSYLAKTDASGNYTLSNVAPGTFSMVATKSGLGRANVQGVQVKSKETSQAADLDLSLTAPAITSVVPPNAAPGETVTLNGDNFGTTSGETLMVAFNGTVATSVQRVDDHKLTVKVPDKARTGDLVVTVAGVVSNAEPFAVIKSLALSPGNLNLVVGDSQTLTVTALDTEKDPVPDPSVRWTVSGAAVSLQGQDLTALARGEATVTITSGRLTSTRQIRVIDHYPQVSTIAGGISGFANGLGSAAQFSAPFGLVVRPNGNLLVADNDNEMIREVTPEGSVTTFAGTGDAGGVNGPRLTAEFSGPQCLALDPNGDLYVTEYSSRIRKFTPQGEVTLWAGNGTDGYQDGPLGSSMFDSPYGIVVAPDYTVFVADWYNHCIRQISNGVVTTLAGKGKNSGFVDGRGAAARFNKPIGLALDTEGNLIVVEAENHALRKVTRDGTVTTIAGGGSAGYYDGNGREALFSKPSAVAVDANGYMYVADMNNHVIRLVTPQGAVSTYAGSGEGSFRDGSARTAHFYLPSGLTFDASGTLYVVDDRIRKIQP